MSPAVPVKYRTDQTKILDATFVHALQGFLICKAIRGFHDDTNSNASFDTLFMSEEYKKCNEQKCQWHNEKLKRAKFIKKYSKAGLHTISAGYETPTV